jgi:hypothetical protein
MNQAIVLPELLLVTQPVAEVVSQPLAHPVEESVLDAFPTTNSNLWWNLLS